MYIILARKTREDAYRQTFNALKRSFATWVALLEAPRRLVLRLVHSGGLSGEKDIEPVWCALEAEGDIRELHARTSTYVARREAGVSLFASRDQPEERTPSAVACCR